MDLTQETGKWMSREANVTADDEGVKTGTLDKNVEDIGANERKTRHSREDPDAWNDPEEEDPRRNLEKECDLEHPTSRNGLNLTIPSTVQNDREKPENPNMALDSLQEEEFQNTIMDNGHYIRSSTLQSPHDNVANALDEEKMGRPFGSLQEHEFHDQKIGNDYQMEPTINFHCYEQEDSPKNQKVLESNEMEEELILESIKNDEIPSQNEANSVIIEEIDNRISNFARNDEDLNLDSLTEDDLNVQKFQNNENDSDLRLKDSNRTLSGERRKGLGEVRSKFKQFIMDCSLCFSKYLLCLFNFIILISGLGVLFIGVWMYTDKDSLVTFARSLDEASLKELHDYTEGDMATYISYLLMAVGGTMFILSILGYCGALRESKCLLGFYGFLLIVILIAEIAAVGLAFVYKDRADGEVRTLLKAGIQRNYDPNANNTILDKFMSEMRCCGVDNYQDFNISDTFRMSGLKVPRSCCIFRDGVLMDPDCPKNPTETNSYFMEGCYQRLLYKIKENMDIVIYVVIGVVCIELLSTFLAFCLCKSIETYDK